MMDMVSGLVVVVVLLVHAYAQAYADINIKCMKILYINYTSKIATPKEICILFKCTEVLSFWWMMDMGVRVINWIFKCIYF